MSSEKFFASFKKKYDNKERIEEIRELFKNSFFSDFIELAFLEGKMEAQKEIESIFNKQTKKEGKK